MKITNQELQQQLKLLRLPQPDSHKGQNGKLLIIGGSQLFHAASRWSLDIASQFVDMVFYASVPSNNQLILEAKQNFWNGIVVAREDADNYAQEADCILIGPGMERHDTNPDFDHQSSQFYLDNPPNKEEWQKDTQKITNYLLAKFSEKKWVIDAGALQMLNPQLITSNCILTPHTNELKTLAQKLNLNPNNGEELNTDSLILEMSQLLNQTTILLKGQIDTIAYQNKLYQIEGGNAGMTKGGTGDVLAGLLAGLYTTNEILPSTIVASYINKASGDWLYKKVGPFYNASALVDTIPAVLWQQLT